MCAASWGSETNRVRSITSSGGKHFDKIVVGGNEAVLQQNSATEECQPF